jgi:hypothetical protein
LAGWAGYMWKWEARAFGIAAKRGGERVVGICLSAEQICNEGQCPQRNNACMQKGADTDKTPVSGVARGGFVGTRGGFRRRGGVGAT